MYADAALLIHASERRELSTEEGLQLMHQTHRIPAVKNYIVTEVAGAEVFRNEIVPRTVDVDYSYHPIFSGLSDRRIRLTSELVYKPKPNPVPIHVSGDVLMEQGLSR